MSAFLATKVQVAFYDHPTENVLYALLETISEHPTRKTTRD
jgi:hypothetical protein